MTIAHRKGIGRTLAGAAMLLLAGGCGGGSAPEPLTPAEEFQNVARWLTEGTNPYLGSGVLTETREQLRDVPAPSEQAMRLEMRLAQALLKAGEPDAALEATERAMAGVDLTRRDRRTAFLLRARAVVHLRRAEVQNCIERHNPSSCIFPLRGDGIHVTKGPALAARDDLEAALTIEPGNLSDRWLLNIVHMAIGDYPQGVPGSFLIPPAAFASHYDIGRFADVAPELGLDTFDLCGGAILDDFDGDGFLDVVTSTYDPNGPLHYFRSTGTGSFEDRAAAAHLTDQLGGLNCLAADYDNDGR
ncbi:FG-GAP-like repeat-containing protein, partial [bacterium]|nr:FG-GAP-like repeat-containing protein [bacterium]